MRNNLRRTNLEMLPMIPSMPGIDDNILESDHHVLISKEYPSEMTPFYDYENEQVITGLFEEIPASTIHKLYIGDFMEQGKGLVKIIDKLQESDHSDQLELHIASHGGSFIEVSQIHNLIDSMYGNRSTSYMSHGYSGGAMIFCTTKERIIYNNSTAMFHWFSGGERGKGYDMLRSLKHAISTIEDYYRNLLGDYFTKKELNRMIKHGKEFWMDADEMIRRGIATGIIIEGEFILRDEYLRRYKSSNKFTKVYKKELKIKKKEQDKDIESQGKDIE